MTAWRAAAVDLGASSGRIVVGRFDGDRLALHEGHRFSNAGVSVAGHQHWDVLRLFEEICSGLGRAQQEHGDLGSVGVDTWGVDFALLDRCGALLGNPYHYRDSRTEGAVEILAERISPATLFERTGVQTMRINTLFQLVALERSSPGTLALAERLLMMPDLFHYWLSGEAAGERTIATTSQMYDPQRGAWASDLLESLGLSAAPLPPLVAAGTDLGPLLPAVREATGLAATRVVAPAGHDTASSVAAIPGLGERSSYISSGTWSLMGVVEPRPVISETVRAASFSNEGGVAGTTRLLKNITGLWLVQECRRAWAKANVELGYAELEAIAEREGPFGAVIDPDDSTLLNPSDMPTALRELCARSGERVPESRGQLLRIALESLACKYRYTLEQLEAITQRRLETLHVVGGGSQNRVLCQLTADVCARPVLAGPVETTALGNFLAQAIAAKVVGGWGQASELVQQSYPPQVYQPRDGARWEAPYHRLKQRLDQAPRTE
jgi:rhamnulokinase